MDSRKRFSEIGHSFIYFIYIVLEGQINFQPRSQALAGAGHVIIEN